MAASNGYRQAVAICLVPTIVACGFASQTIAAAGDPDAAAARAVFAEKCFECHGPAAKKVEKFGYINDLGQLASNPKYIARGDPDHSKLWRLVRDEEMPPEDSEIPPLTDAQKAAVRQWIEAGAPAGAGTVAAARPTLPIGRRILRLLGRMHVAAVHLPIAFILGAAAAELLALRSRRPWLAGGVRFCIAAAATSAVAAGALGWLDASFQTTSELLTVHRWLGTSLAALTLPLVILCERGMRAAGDPLEWQGRSRATFRALLVVAVALVAATGHAGGSMVFGAGYFRF
jgi:mono/diheme cytochrome c family protein